MSKSIHRLIQELRGESCPPHVLAKVRERIAKERGPIRDYRLALRRFALAAGFAVVLLCTVTRWYPISKPDPATSHPGQPLTAAEVADQTHLTLACIGTTVVEAGNRTETIIVNHIKPRLLDCLDKAVKAFPQR